MNSKFQKSPGGANGGRSPSTSDPPYASSDGTDSPSPASSPTGTFPSGGSSWDTTRSGSTTPGAGARFGSSSDFAAKPEPSGSEALRKEAEDTVGAAAETIAAASDAVSDATSQIGDVAKEAMRATVSAVSAQAAELTSNITHELTATAESQKERGADAMHRFAKAIRTAAHELEEGSPEIARQIRAAAGGVDSLSDNIHTKSVADLFNAAQDFARKQPAAFFAGAVIAGFAVSRFLKSSSQPAQPSNGHDQAMARPAPIPGSQVTPSAPSAEVF
jgi:hypothetical protein